jgi:hypothetical protein
MSDFRTQAIAHHILCNENSRRTSADAHLHFHQYVWKQQLFLPHRLPVGVSRLFRTCGCKIGLDVLWRKLQNPCIREDIPDDDSNREANIDPFLRVTQI